MQLKNEDPKFHNWFIGLQNVEAGRWLDVIPFMPKLTLSNKEFVTQIRYRMFLEFARWRSDLVCVCGNKSKISKHGDHLAAGCGICSQRNRMHDAVKLELLSLLRWARYDVINEERGLFLNPNHHTLNNAVVNADTEDGQNLRPDLSINNYGPLGEKLLLDVSIPSTLSFNSDGSQQSHGVGYNANKTYERKVNTYGQKCIERNYLFEPIIIESCGFVHKKSAAIIKKLVNAKEADLECKRDGIYVYVMKVLSITLQKYLAQSMNVKMDNIMRKASHGQADFVHDICAAQDMQKVYS